MTEVKRVKINLEDGGYVEIRPNEIGPGVFLEVGWPGEALCEVLLNGNEHTQVASALVLPVDVFRPRPASPDNPAGQR